MIWVVGMDQYIIHDTVLYTLRESLICVSVVHMYVRTHTLLTTRAALSWDSHFLQNHRPLGACTIP